MKHYSTAGAHQPFIQSRLLLMYSGLATSAGHYQTIEQKWLRGCELKGCARLCSKRLARMERAISFQTRGIPKSMFSQKRAFHPADLLTTRIYINIYKLLFQGDFYIRPCCLAVCQDGSLKLLSCETWNRSHAISCLKQLCRTLRCPDQVEEKITMH